MLHSFFHNMILLIGALFISLKLRDYISKKTSIHMANIWTFSIYASLLSILIMFNSYIYEGMVIDIRSIPIFFVSYVYGWKAGLISFILPSLFRYYIGGPTIWQGIIMGILSPIIVGSLFHKSKQFDEQYRFFSIKRILLAYSTHCVIRAVLMWFILPISHSLWLKLNVNITSMSLISLFCMVLFINDSNKNMLLRIEMDKKQKKIEDLNSKLLNSNNTLITIIDVMPIGVIITDTEGNIILTNATSANILGGNANQLGGRLINSNDRVYSLHRLDGSEISLKKLPYWQTLENGKTMKDQEILIRRKDGKEKIVLVSSTPIYDDKNNIINGVGVFQDITHLKIIEERLHEGRKINEAFLNGITEILILVDRKGTILSLNETCAKELGLKVNEARGLNIFDFLLPELKEKTKKKVDEFNELKEQVSFEQKFEERYLDITFYPITNNYWNVEKFVIFAKDITKLKEAEESKNIFIKELSNEREKLKDKNHKLTLLSKQHMTTLEILYKKNEELKIANRAKNNFIANVSHELKTPLNITMTYLEYLLEEQDGDLNKEQKEMLQVAYSNADRLQYLIEDMLHLSLIEAQKMKFNFENINLISFLNTLIRDRILTIKDKNINIKLYALQDDIFVVTDMLRFRQVIDNILDNAIKFSNEGDIEVSLKEKQSSIEIYIKDSGIGINPDKFDEIFEPFYQIDDSSKKKYKGVGLGLYIAKKTIKALGGDISVKNNVDKGCCFKLNIPFDSSSV